MPDKVIPQRELRNQISAVLRAAQAGQTFTITVRGRPAARLVPPGEPDRPRVYVDRERVRQILALPIDPDLASELEAAEAPLDDPWPAA